MVARSTPADHGQFYCCTTAVHGRSTHIRMLGTRPETTKRARSKNQTVSSVCILIHVFVRLFRLVSVIKAGKRSISEPNFDFIMVSRIF